MQPVLASLFVKLHFLSSLFTHVHSQKRICRPFSPSLFPLSAGRFRNAAHFYAIRGSYGGKVISSNAHFFRLVEERLSDIVTHLTQTLIEGHILSERSRVDRPRLYVTLRSYVSQYPRGAVKRVVDQLGWLNPFRIAECGTDRRPLALRRPRRPPRY